MTHNVILVSGVQPSDSTTAYPTKCHPHKCGHHLPWYKVITTIIDCILCAVCLILVTYLFNNWKSVPLIPFTWFVPLTGNHQFVLCVYESVFFFVAYFFICFVS